jgi:hypothetical protein
MSPGSSAFIATAGSARCSPDVRGIERPALRHAVDVSPEQSKQSGPAPPQQYGLPRCDSANAAAAAPCEPRDGVRRSGAGNGKGKGKGQLDGVVAHGNGGVCHAAMGADGQNENGCGCPIGTGTAATATGGGTG